MKHTVYNLHLKIRIQWRISFPGISCAQKSS